MQTLKIIIALGVVSLLSACMGTGTNSGVQNDGQTFGTEDTDQDMSDAL